MRSDQSTQPNAKMSRVSRGISLVFYFFLYLVNFSIEKSPSSRFGFRVVRETKVEKLQTVNENEFFDVVGSEGERRKRRVERGKSKRGVNYEVNGPKLGRKLFSRNKVAPMVPDREEAWTEASEKKKAANVESHRGLRVMGDHGRPTEKHSLEYLNSKTAREIKTSEKTEPSLSRDNLIASFFNDLTPPSAVGFSTCQSNGLPCDPFFVEEASDDDVTSSSVGAISYSTLNLRKGKAWEEEFKLKHKKSTVNKFLSRFKRVKKTKVKKVHL